MRPLALVLALVAVMGCKTKEHAPKKQKPVAGMSEVELKRGEDACKTYVDRVCTCASVKTDLAQQCELARALPDAMKIALSVATHPDSKPDIVEQSYDSVRRTVGECIEQTAKLPTVGCN